MKYRFIKLNTGKLISIRGLSEQRIKALYFTYHQYHKNYIYYRTPRKKAES